MHYTCIALTWGCAVLVCLRVVPNVNFFALCRTAPTKAAAVAAITEWAEENGGVHLNSSGIYSRITRQGCCWNERGFYKEGEAEMRRGEERKWRAALRGAAHFGLHIPSTVSKCERARL